MLRHLVCIGAALTLFGAGASWGADKHGTTEQGKFAPGYFHILESEINYLLKPNGTGQIEVDGEDTPMTWKQDGNEIVVSMPNENAIGKEYVLRWTIKDADTLQLDEDICKREPNAIVETYEFIEPGMSGDFTRLRWKDNDTSWVNIATVTDSGNLCELSVSCSGKGEVLKCNELESAEPVGQITLKPGANGIMELETTIDQSEICGNNAFLTGKYRLVR